MTHPSATTRAAKAALTLTLLLPPLTADSATPQPQSQPNHTIIVSLDGFRHDYPQSYDTPFFDQMARDGVQATMMPSFPTKTFPNHYTMATGLVPEHHGIIANSFLDRKQAKHYSLSDTATRSDSTFYGGEPVWNTIRRQGHKTATVYWVGSDLPLPSGQADYWLDYNKKPLLSFQQRVDTTISLLRLPEAQRPRLIMVYFEEPDAVGHHYGPHSKQTRATVAALDSLLATLWTRIQALPIKDHVNLIVTSDHGMAAVSPDRTIPVMSRLKATWVESVDGNLPGQIYCRPGCADSVADALQNVPHLRAYKRADVPAYLQYNDNQRIGDVVAIPDLGWLFTDDTHFNPGGTHGFDNTNDDMHVMFRAIGPDFRQGYKKPGKFQNTCLYSLLCRLLHVTPQPTDGTLLDVADMLAQPTL